MKKLELENFGVVEMEAKEMKETDGGFLGLLIAAALVVEVVCYATAGDIILDFNHYTGVVRKGMERGAAAAH